MRNMRHLQRKFAAFALIAGMGGMMFTNCSADIRKNIIAGSLSYVKSGAQTFWDNAVPQKDVWEGVFGRGE
jgi:hypothetical protein